MSVESAGTILGALIVFGILFLVIGGTLSRPDPRGSRPQNDQAKPAAYYRGYSDTESEWTGWGEPSQEMRDSMAEKRAENDARRAARQAERDTKNQQRNDWFANYDANRGGWMDLDPAAEKARRWEEYDRATRIGSN